MKVAVKDANVLIDLVEGDLLGLWFRLGIETYVPDLVLDEIKHPNHRRMVLAMVEAGNLRVGTFSPAQLSQVDSYKQRYRISLADASAILLAEQMQATLLSGDKLVRKGGLSLDLKVRGLLWVFDELVLRELLGAVDAAVRLERVVDAGAHLPAEQVQARLRKWRTASGVFLAMPMDSRVEGFETRAFGFIEEELAELRFTVSSEGFYKATVIFPGRLPQKRMTRLPTLSSALSPGCPPAASVGPGAQRF